MELKDTEANSHTEREWVTVPEFLDACEAGKTVDPLKFLELVMAGVDPRYLSEICKLLDTFSYDYDGRPSVDDWHTLTNLIEAKYRLEPVELKESLNAGKDLANYMHPKRKHVDMNAEINANVTVKILTTAEILSVRAILDET